MNFTSPIFLFAFLPAVLLVHFALRSTSHRNMFLLIMSVLFYAWGEPRFVFLLLFSALVNAGLGQAIERWRYRSTSILAGGVVFNLAILVYFKYADFLFASLAPWTGFSPEWTKVALPLAISFFTFQAITYLVAVFRREVPAQRNPARVALYIFFFPQLIAGPIVRYPEIARALISRRITSAAFASGVRQFVKGLALKVLIADVLAVPVDRIFSLPASELSQPVAWLGAVCYALQIYFDFSGYSDMALGLARMFGFEFPKNFDHPYISRSIREFWRRWHISLSTFFRDFVYIPLGGDRGSRTRTAFNLVLVFFLCGFWHGASWTFVVWGLYHGFFILLERSRWGTSLCLASTPVRWAYTMLVLLIGWVIFRAESIEAAQCVLGAMVLAKSGPSPLPVAAVLDNAIVAAILAGILFSTPVVPATIRRALLRMKRSHAVATRRLVTFVRTGGAALTVGFFLLAAVWIAGQTYRPFIYFRF